MCKHTMILLGIVCLPLHIVFALPTPSINERNPCQISIDGRSANCLGQRLNRVPWKHLHSTLERVDLSYNELQTIYVDDFSRLHSLRYLELQYNNISVIQDHAFNNNSFLEYLNIFNNSLEEIPATALQPLSNLRILLMSNNLYTKASLAFDIFSSFIHLQDLSMGGPLVKGLRKGDFQALKNIQLQVFSIKSSSNISYYEPGSLKAIKTSSMMFDMAIDQKPHFLPLMLQDLANKTFSVIQFRNLFEFMYYTGDEDIFRDLPNIKVDKLIFHRGKFNENLLRMALLNLQVTPVKQLTFQYIDFARSPNFVDSGLISSINNLYLDRLDLWHISNPDILRFDWRFTWFNKIQLLSIQNVNFNSVPCDAWIQMGRLDVLDISNNRLKDEFIFNQRCDYGTKMPTLLTFNISTNELTSLENLASLISKFKQLLVVDFSNNMLGSADKSRNCNWVHNITKVIAHHNQFKSDALKCLPTTVQYLDLSDCDLDQLDMAYFQQTTSLKELLLNGNKIKFIPSGWKSLSLNSLALDGNSFGIINVGSFQNMPQLSRLRSGNNPYHCTCDLHAFIQDTISKGKINITDWPENYKCYYPEDLFDTAVANFFPGHVACDIRLVIVISVAMTTAVVLVLVLICYIFNIPWYTKAMYQILRAKYRAHQEGAFGESQIYDYHAFISYSHPDADWVREQLLPCLEDNKPPYRLCIHERDFMPGKWIIDNIIENIESSRKVIFVLSHHFVNSEWCNYELYFAQQRSIGKMFNDVILVVKEPIDPESLPSKYCKLKKMLNTKTYLEWPQQEKQQSFFWAQLKSVLGKPALIKDHAVSTRSSRVSSVGDVDLLEIPQEDRMSAKSLPMLE